MLGAGDRMRGHEMHARGQVRRHVAHDRALDRADVGHDRARLQMRADLGRDRAAGADRDADDDEIGAFDRRRIGLDHLIGDAELGDAPARGGRARRRDDRARRALRARRARDRGADQADADQREAVEDGDLSVECRAFLCGPFVDQIELPRGIAGVFLEASSDGPFDFRRASSHAPRNSAARDHQPVRLLAADRHAQRIRQLDRPSRGAGSGRAW